MWRLMRWHLFIISNRKSRSIWWKQYVVSWEAKKEKTSHNTLLNPVQPMVTAGSLCWKFTNTQIYPDMQSLKEESSCKWESGDCYQYLFIVLYALPQMFMTTVAAKQNNGLNRSWCAQWIVCCLCLHSFKCTKQTLM